MSQSGPTTLERSPVDDDGARRRAVSRRTVLGGVAASVALAACSELDGINGLEGIEGLEPTLTGDGAAPASEAASAGDGASAGGGALPAPAPAPAVPGATVTPVLADDDALHLLRRATFGPTAELVAQVRDMGPSAWLAAQLAPDGIDDSACDEALSRYPMLDKTARQIKDTDRKQGGEQEADRDLVEAAVVRAVCTQRQVFEVMVEFWANYFSIHTPSGDNWGRRTVSDREVYRPHTLGNFGQLLLASAKDPAMLRYLDNEDSCFDGDPTSVQENYGREVLELHTVGVDGGYTEEDVKNSAYILTGWTTDGDRLFRYDPGCHYVGPVQVMDFSHPNDSAEGGLAVGEAYLDHLARHPATATYVCTRLARRFVSDEPSEALVADLASVFTANADSASQIAEVVSTLFSHAEFSAAVGQKIKRPLEDIVSSARALGVTVRPRPAKDRTRTLLDAAYDLGQAPMDWGPPDGYPDVATPWLSSARLLGSWNYHWDLVDGRYDDWLTDADEAIAALAALEGVTVGELVDAVAQRLLWQPIPAGTRAAIAQFTGKAETDPVGDDREGTVRRIALAVLNSPFFLQR